MYFGVGRCQKCHRWPDMNHQTFVGGTIANGVACNPKACWWWDTQFSSLRLPANIVTVSTSPKVNLNLNLVGDAIGFHQCKLKDFTGWTKDLTGFHNIIINQKLVGDAAGFPQCKLKACRWRDRISSVYTPKACWYWTAKICQWLNRISPAAVENQKLVGDFLYAMSIPPI